MRTWRKARRPGPMRKKSRPRPNGVINENTRLIKSQKDEASFSRKLSMKALVSLPQYLRQDKERDDRHEPESKDGDGQDHAVELLPAMQRRHVHGRIDLGRHGPLAALLAGDALAGGVGPGAQLLRL